MARISVICPCLPSENPNECGDCSALRLYGDRTDHAPSCTNCKVDALTLGVQLKAKERKAREGRIARVLQPTRVADNFTREARVIIADAIYNARWDGHKYDDEVTPGEVLDGMCWRIFDASYEEVLEAWDKFLG